MQTYTQINYDKAREIGYVIDDTLLQIVNLSNEGKKRGELRGILKMKGDDINQKMRNAIFLGVVEIKDAPDGSIKEVIDRAKRGENIDEISANTNMPKASVSKFLTYAIKKGLLSSDEIKMETKMKIFLSYFYSGIKDNAEIAKKSGLSIYTILRLHAKAQDLGLIETKKTEEEVINQKIGRIITSFPYAVQVANRIGIEPYVVYDYLESLSDEKKEGVIRGLIRDNKLFNLVKRKVEEENITALDAMEDLARTLNGSKLILLSRLFHHLEYTDRSLELLEKVKNSKEESYAIRKKAETERKMILLDVIRKEFMTKKASRESLAEKYNIKDKYLSKILGESRKLEEDNFER